MRRHTGRQAYSGLGRESRGTTGTGSSFGGRSPGTTATIFGGKSPRTVDFIPALLVLLSEGKVPGTPLLFLEGKVPGRYLEYRCYFSRGSYRIFGGERRGTGNYCCCFSYGKVPVRYLQYRCYFSRGKSRGRCTFYCFHIVGVESPSMVLLICDTTVSR